MWRVRGMWACAWVGTRGGHRTVVRLILSYCVGSGVSGFVQHVLLPTVLLCFSAAVRKHWLKRTWGKERVYSSIQVIAKAGTQRQELSATWALEARSSLACSCAVISALSPPSPTAQGWHCCTEGYPPTSVNWLFHTLLHAIWWRQVLRFCVIGSFQDHI